MDVVLSVDAHFCAHPQEDVSRFLGPRPGQSNVYRIGNTMFPEMVATGRTTGRPNSVLIEVTFRNPNRSPSAGKEAVGYQYVIETSGGARWKRAFRHSGQISSELQNESADDPGIVFRSPLRVGTSGWSWWSEGKGVDAKDAFGPCHIVAVETSAILGEPRSAVTVSCGIKEADGTETLLTEVWADGLGMVKHREGFIDQKGRRSPPMEDVLAAVEPAR